MDRRLLAAVVPFFALWCGCSSPYGAADPAPPPATSPPGADTAAGCDPQGPYRFCDDFDHDSSLAGAGWETSVGGSGKLALDAEALSPPIAAHTSIRPGVTSTAALAKELALTSSKGRAELDLLLDTDLASISVGASLVAVGLRSGEHAAIAVQAGKVILQVGDALQTVRHIPLDGFPVGTWTHVVLEVTFDGTDGHVLVSADGKPLFDQRGLVMSADDSQTSTFRFIAGVVGLAEVPLSLRLDNVKVF